MDLQKAQVQLETARAQVNRYRGLTADQMVSKEQFEKLADTARALGHLAEAGLDLAALSLTPPLMHHGADAAVAQAWEPVRKRAEEGLAQRLMTAGLAPNTTADDYQARLDFELRFDWQRARVWMTDSVVAACDAAIDAARAAVEASLPELQTSRR